MIYGDPIRTVAPTVLPVTLAEFKAHARVDTTDEDAIMMAYLRAAVEFVEQYTGLSLLTSTWTQTASAWPTTKEPDLILWRRPVQSVLSVDFMGAVGSPPGDSVLDPSVYRIIGLAQDKTPARVRLGYLQSWPTAVDDPEAITITYVAGFGDDHNAVPEVIRHAIYMAAGTWYAQRENIAFGENLVPRELPFGSTALLRPWRPLAWA